MIQELTKAQGAINAVFPKALEILFLPKMPDGRPVRYRVLYGGRGGGKSWGIARALLLKGLEAPLRVLCARELQNSISDSVHRLLADQVHNLGLDAEYTVQRDTILGRNGTSFVFEGIRHNINRIRSYEGIDICWVEEAVKVTRSSWEVLVPTIRKEGSELWLSFNPELEEDYIYKEFVKNPPDNALIQMVNWRDNPWFTAENRRDKDHLKSRDLASYLNVWEGECRQILEGAIYAQEMRDAQEEKRLTTEVPYDQSIPVDCFFDLGKHDLTAIWFAQKVGFQYRVLNYYQNNQRNMTFYLKYLQKQEYVYGTIWLPHDGAAKNLGQDLSCEEQTRKHGFKCRIVPKLSIADGINAARTIFPECWFDPKRCEDGIQALRHYRYEVDPDTKAFSKDPYHDPLYSHGADAFRYLAVALKAPKARGKTEEEGRNLWDLPDWVHEGLHWMGH